MLGESGVHSRKSRQRGVIEAKLWAKRNPAAIGLAAVLGLVVLIGVVSYVRAPAHRKGGSLRNMESKIVQDRPPPAVIQPDPASMYEPPEQMARIRQDCASCLVRLNFGVSADRLAGQVSGVALIGRLLTLWGADAAYGQGLPRAHPRVAGWPLRVHG